MKTKIAMIIVAAGLAVSFGIIKESKAAKDNKKAPTHQTSDVKDSGTMGGFTSEEH